MARMSVEERREALIEAAYRVIADHGVEGATTRRVCAQAKMPLASFHYAFESRMALLTAVIDQAVPRTHASLADEIREYTPAGDLPGDGLAGVEREVDQSLQALFLLIVKDPGRVHATMSLALYSRQQEELRMAGREMWERLYELGAATLESIAQRHGTGWSLPPEKLGPLLIAATNAVGMVYLTTTDEKQTEQVIDAIKDWIMTYAVAAGEGDSSGE
jgi:AcrR family transcriptional regulator